MKVGLDTFSVSTIGVIEGVADSVAAGDGVGCMTKLSLFPIDESSMTTFFFSLASLLMKMAYGVLRELEMLLSVHLPGMKLNVLAFTSESSSVVSI